eukprot:jgi/Bigna1/44070/e_gw1.88.51.1
MRWALTFAIAISTALIAVAITWFTKTFLRFKLKTAQDLMDREGDGEVFRGASFLFVMAMTIGYVVVGGLLVMWEPVAAGSGIPEIKSLLNGIMMKRSMRIKTLFAKATGVVFAVSGGLPVGKEGPMIHTGAILGAGLSQGKSSTFGFDTQWSKFLEFRNDREKRDFIACGAAAGVAAAFGAPLAGVMFCLEEGASWWHPDLTWRTLFCAMCSDAVTTVFLSGIKGEVKAWGEMSKSGLLDFGGETQTMEFTLWEIPGFMLLGALGGLIGAYFNMANEHLTEWRRHNISTRVQRYVEVVCIASFVAILAFGIPAISGGAFCKKLDAPDNCPSRESVMQYTTRFYCKEDEFDSLASVWFNSPDKAIKFLFYEPSHNDISSECNLNPAVLILFFIPYACCACIVYGIAMPSGMFVPMILSGAALGRLYGYMLSQLWASVGIAEANHGTYALLGSVAMLGGVTRMLISVTLIIIETTGEVQFGLPVFLTAVAARVVGQMVNEGLYDIHMELRHIPFLPWDPPAWFQTLSASQIMRTQPVTLNEIETAEKVLQVLKESTHNGFPIVIHDYNSRKKSSLTGIILRKHLSQLLSDKFKHRALLQPDHYEKKGAYQGKRRSDTANNLQWDELESTPLRTDWHLPSICFKTPSSSLSPSPCPFSPAATIRYPHFPHVDTLKLTENEKNCWVELGRYCDPVPHAVPANASVWQCYQRFRQLGLRHLCVVDRHGDVIGMITRQDLTIEHCRQCHELSLKKPSIQTWRPMPSHQRSRVRSEAGAAHYRGLDSEWTVPSRRRPPVA